MQYPGPAILMIWPAYAKYLPLLRLHTDRHTPFTKASSRNESACSQFAVVQPQVCYHGLSTLKIKSSAPGRGFIGPLKYCAGIYYELSNDDIVIWYSDIHICLKNSSECSTFTYLLYSSFRFSFGHRHVFRPPFYRMTIILIYSYYDFNYLEIRYSYLQELNMKDI